MVYVSQQCDSATCEMEVEFHVSQTGLICDECKEKKVRYAFEPASKEAEIEADERSSLDLAERIIAAINLRLEQVEPHASNYMGRVPGDWQEVAADADLPTAESAFKHLEFGGEFPDTEEIDGAIAAAIVLPDGYEGVAVDLITND